jgi:23S rRNA (adenine2503-C2)-methyltransferase
MIMEDIRSISGELFDSFLRDVKQPKFRRKQVEQWLWEKGINSFDDMRNVPAALIDALKQNFELKKAELIDKQEAIDGTVKAIFRFSDGTVSEGVYIPSTSRVTACVSSQTGCSLNCSFCATGRLHKNRNLSSGEIFDQVFEIKKMAEEKGNNLTNIVYMGMGEPLLNYDSVIESINRVTGKPGLEMSPSRITLSTAGIVPGIRRLADDGVRFNLAVSLHSAKESTRNELMPINKKYNLKELSEAIQYFYKKTGERITFEYLMLNNVNDSVDEAEALADFCKAFPVKINLIEYNPVPEFDYLPSTAERLKRFEQFLLKRNMIVNVRRSRGKEIAAACGQLANRGLKK